MDIKYFTRTSYMFTNGYYVKIREQRNVNYTQTQPQYSKYHKCTAAITDIIRVDYPWVTIPCDVKLYASYFCQPKKDLIELFPRSTQPTMKCDGDWLLLQDTETCLLVQDTGHREISFHDSQYLCSLHNATVYRVDISDRVNVTSGSSKLKSDLLYGIAKMHGVTSYITEQFVHTLQNMSSVNIRNMLFGRRLNRDSIKSMFPWILLNIYKALGEMNATMTFFAENNQTCSIVEFLELVYDYKDDSYVADEWGVKCRPCSEQIKISGLICEKPADININKCQNNLFECVDKTCLLYIYKCDHVFDCFDYSDEIGCMYNIRDMDEYVTLPCLPDNDCDINVGNKVLLHGVCDGLYFQDVFLPEDEVCIVNNPMTGLSITKRSREHSFRSNKFTSRDLFRMFSQERKYTCTKSSKISFINVSHAAEYDRLVPGLLLRQNTKLNDVCLARGQNNTCNSPICRSLCFILLCPGMFKCHDHVCIPLSYYCDNIYHCIYGEDERTCSMAKLSCPGYLKCRGEKKCISTYEICDKHINCLYSMDDELGCDTCPSNCECKAYVMTCYTNNSEPMIERGQVFYKKGLIIKGTQHVLIAKSLKFIGLLYLNISHCELNTVDVVYDDTDQLLFILFADFRHNRLTNTLFLTSLLFHRAVYLDLSFNLLDTFKYGRTLSLVYLKVLCLIGNNLNEIAIIIDKGRLALIDLQFISYHPKIAAQIEYDYNLNINLVVKVTDFQLCCMFSDNVKCFSKQYHMTCYGIFATLRTKISFYLLSSLSLCISLIMLIKQAMQTLSKNSKYQVKIHHSIMLMNQSVGYILCSLYLVSLFTMDIFKVKLLLFKTSISCIILNAVLYISLEGIIIFKSSLSFMIALKIMFPFRYQCTWLKWVGLATGFVWLFIVSTYMTHYLLNVRHNPTFDRLCSIGWCEMQVNLNLLHVVIYFVDQVAIFVYVLAFLLTYTSLKKHLSKFTCETSTNHYSASAVTCKCVFANIIEIILRIYLCIILCVKLGHWKFKYLCLYFFIYALPINILFSNLFYIFR